ncbi:MAG: hypothetical protein HYT16_02690 [DPANN group archaeon]|nr:hypothetical protein [DPANN group archaeon]
MGILDIFKRKKKDDDFLDLGAPGTTGGAYGPAGYPQGYGGDMGLGAPGQQAGGQMGGGFDQFPNPAGMQAGGAAGGEIANLRNTVDALNYKLDALKAALDAINARLANIETALKAAPTEKGEGWTY